MRLSQSSIKDLAKLTTCPLRWKGQWIDEKFKTPINDAMSMGLHFEKLVLGENATDENMPPLPMTKTGKPTIDVVRMEQQADRIAGILFNSDDPDYIGYNVTDKQSVVWLDDLRGVIDFMAEDEEGNPCMFDLKLTKDLANTFGAYAWGNLENIDFFQQVVYEMAWEDENGTELAENNLLVADYSPELRVKLIKLTVTPEAKEAARKRIEATREVIAHYTENGFPTDPSLEECARCPLTCDKRFIKPSLDIEEFIV